MKQAIVALSLLGLASCSSAQVSTTLASICQAAAPAIQQVAAKGASQPSTSATNVTLGYVTGVCTASGAVAASTDPTGAPVDPSWLETAIQTAATLAEIAAPLLPALGV